jgi:putative endonuclease
VKRRFEEHRGNNGRGSKYLRGKKPLELVLEMEIGSKSLALKVEGRVKKLTKVTKEMFVGGRLNIQEIIPADWAEGDSCSRRQ